MANQSRHCLPLTEAEVIIFIIMFLSLFLHYSFPALLFFFCGVQILFSTQLTLLVCIQWQRTETRCCPAPKRTIKVVHNIQKLYSRSSEELKFVRQHFSFFPPEGRQRPYTRLVIGSLLFLVHIKSNV